MPKDVENPATKKEKVKHWFRKKRKMIISVANFSTLSSKVGKTDFWCVRRMPIWSWNFDRLLIELVTLANCASSIEWILCFCDMNYFIVDCSKIKKKDRSRKNNVTQPLQTKKMKSSHEITTIIHSVTLTNLTFIRWNKCSGIIQAF